MIAEIEHIARENQVTSAQVALAWVLLQGKDIVPIPGTSKEIRLMENIGALKVKLNREDLIKIDSIASQFVGDFEVSVDALGTL
ncbi:aldo/keto reductase [Paenibacillus humicola]|uniref:aldo/keto reductase n=1 Tax=Paenibacillus humicola TaxID=3110540 RepID=UPI0030845488